LDSCILNHIGKTIDEVNARKDIINAQCSAFNVFPVYK